MRRVDETVDAFVERLAFVTELDDKTTVRVRPIAPKDRDRLVEGLENLSPRSRYLRFLASRDTLSDADLAYLTELDYGDHFAWGMEVHDDPARPGVGVARYIRADNDPTVAEAAVTVIDAYQGKGAGRILLEKLIEAASANGIERFRAYVSSSNQPVIGGLTKLGASVTEVDGGMVSLELPLPERPFRESRLYAALRTVAAQGVRP